MSVTKAELEAINGRLHEAVRILSAENLTLHEENRQLQAVARLRREAERAADAALRATERLRAALARLGERARHLEREAQAWTPERER